jgi:DNA repair protein RecO (recombination protein O)
MEIECPAIVLGLQDYNGDLMLMQVLTAKYGLRKGIVRNTNKNKSALAIGNILQVKWYARLETHLGNFTVQSFEAIAQSIYHDRRRLLSSLSVCALFKSCLSEKEPQEQMYVQLENFLYALKFQNPLWVNMLVILELELLSHVGFGLDLEKCAATGTAKNLAYLSPKTGRAICFESGLPFHEKLFQMPKLFADPNVQPESQDILHAMRVTRYFFMKNIFQDRQSQFPSMRIRLEELLSEC